MELTWPHCSYLIHIYTVIYLILFLHSWWTNKPGISLCIAAIIESITVLFFWIVVGILVPSPPSPVLWFLCLMGLARTGLNLVVEGTHKPFQFRGGWLVRWMAACTNCVDPLLLSMRGRYSQNHNLVEFVNYLIYVVTVVLCLNPTVSKNFPSFEPILILSVAFVCGASMRTYHDPGVMESYVLAANMEPKSTSQKEDLDSKLLGELV